MEQLRREDRKATLLRMLQALMHYESVGVIRGELPPAPDFFGRVLSGAERRAREGVREVAVVVIEDDDVDGATPGRSYAPVDVEEYLNQHRDSLWEHETTPANSFKADPDDILEAAPASGAPGFLYEAVLRKVRQL